MLLVASHHITSYGCDRRLSCEYNHPNNIGALYKKFKINYNKKCRSYVKNQIPEKLIYNDDTKKLQCPSWWNFEDEVINSNNLHSNDILPYTIDNDIDITVVINSNKFKNNYKSSNKIYSNIVSSNKIPLYYNSFNK